MRGFGLVPGRMTRCDAQRAATRTETGTRVGTAAYAAR
jgi:hypothetical protein